MSQEFLKALAAIRGAALACEYKIPASNGRDVDYDDVNVRFTARLVSMVANGRLRDERANARNL